MRWDIYRYIHCNASLFYYTTYQDHMTCRQKVEWLGQAEQHLHVSNAYKKNSNYYQYVKERINHRKSETSWDWNPRPSDC